MRPPLLPRLLLLAALLLGARAEPLGAQAGSALTGRVVDAATSAAVAGARVRVEGSARRAALSGPDGAWRVDDLPAGVYRVRIDHPGFAAFSGRVEIGAGGEPATLYAALAAEAIPLDELVVTAARRAQPLADVPTVVEVVSREEIEAAGVSDLSAVLVQRLGIQLEGGHPAGEGVMLQGLGSERVLVLLDGQPFVGRISGQVDLSRVPTAMVERVEVVKGPQSALYGSAAMAGVVNIITRRPPGDGLRGGLSATAGTQARADVSGSLGGAAGGLRLRADAGRRTTELTPGQADEQGALAERWDGMVRAEWLPAPALTVEASALLLDERQRWQTGTLFNFADNRQWSTRLGAEWVRGDHRIAPAVYATEFSHLSRRATASQPVEGSGEEESQRLLEAELLYTRALGRHSLDAGVEATREGITSERVVGAERSLHTVAPFVQATWAPGAWRVTPGARLTWSEQWGTHFTPHVAAMVRPAESLALRGSLGRGYRAPAFKELYMEFLNLAAGAGYTVRGNPDLRPETSTNLSVGAEWTRARGHLRAQLFHNRFDSFIETRLQGDSSGVAVYTYGNIADGTTRGVEVEGGISFGATRAEAGYGFLDAFTAGDGDPLLGRPRHSGRLSLEHAVRSGPRVSLTGVLTGRTPISWSEQGTPVERAAFLRWDAAVAQRLPRGLELSVGARNLFDARPEEWPGYARRHLYLTVGWEAADALR